MFSHSTGSSGEKGQSYYRNYQSSQDPEEKITFPQIPDQIHKVPDSIRRAIKVGKFRKNANYANKSGSPQQSTNESDERREKIGMNLQVRKIFNFMPGRRIDDLHEEDVALEGPSPKFQVKQGGPVASDPAARYFGNETMKMRNSTGGGGMLYVKKKLSPLKKGLTVEPRSIVSRDKKNIKVTFLNIQKVELAKMYDNFDALDKKNKKSEKNSFAMTASMGSTSGKSEYLVQNFLQSTSFSKNCMLRRSHLSNEGSGFKIKVKPFVAPFQRYLYRDFIWKSALSYNVFHEAPECYSKKIKVFIGRGNNSMLIKSIIKRRRAWMTFTDRSDDATFIWTQIKINDVFRHQKNQKSLLFQQFPQCPSINFPIPGKQTHEQSLVNSAVKKNLTENQINHLKLISPHDLAHWQEYFLKTRKSEDLLDQTMKRRNKNFTAVNKVGCKKLQKIDFRSDQKSLKIHNHLPNNYIIGNKKALFYTMSRYYEGLKEEVFEYLPLTFHVQNGLEDNEYLKFLNHYYARAKIVRAREKGIKQPIQVSNDDRRQQQEEEEPNSPSRTPVRNMWIVKPGQFTNRGNGITVCMNLQEIKAILKRKQRHDNGNFKTYIIQSYLEKPFLYQRRKFDIRHYMMITSINGIIKGYWYEEGYIRTTSFEYSINNCLSNVHLTNDAVQKYLPEYGKYEKGNKVSYSDFQKYLEKEYQGRYNFYDEIYPKMKKIATDSIKACSLLIDPEKKGHNFQIFGMDFMIDADFHPWLIEINNNPCLQISSNVLKDVIPPMVENAFKICVDSLIPPPANFSEKRPKFNGNSFEENKFELVFDSFHEEQDMKTLFGSNQSLQLDYKQLQKDQDQVYDDDGIQLDEY